MVVLWCSLISELAAAPQRALHRHFSLAEQHEHTQQHFQAAARRLAAEVSNNPDSDLFWVDTPNAWHQSLARIVDHRFTTFAELHRFALRAKKAGVSALMLIQINKVGSCPGPWYNGLQLCDHINGSYPAADGSLPEWRQMLSEIAPMRLMWWTNPAYWSVQGPVWAQAVANRASDVSSWFSWSDDDSCKDMPGCMGRSVAVPGIGCAQGSWGSEEGYSGEYSALASFGSRSYANYMVDAMANSWTRNLGIDGYCEDVSANYGCMLQTLGRGSMPYWREIVARVRAQQPQVVMSGENYGSWANIIESAADLGGQGSAAFHEIMRHAVLAGDLSGLEETASTSGADAATVVCYLHPAFDGKQPGGCPTLYYRDQLATLGDVRTHQFWVALEAGSGIVSQHDYDPDSTCMGWPGCAYWKARYPGAWWNVTADPVGEDEGGESPLWAFTRERALNRLALRTKLRITHFQPNERGLTDGGALAYLKHDALGPNGDACVLIFNPQRHSQSITLDLSSVLPSDMLDGHVTPRDLFKLGGTSQPRTAPPPLAASWTLEMGPMEVRALGGFALSSFVPRRGKRGMCTATDGYRQRADGATTMQMCFLACLVDARCANVHVGYVHISYMERPPEIECTLLGPVPSPLTACAEGTGTLIRRLDGGRPSAPPPVPLPTPGPSPPPQSPPPRQAYPGATLEALSEYRARVLRHVTYDISRVSSDIATLNSLPVLTQESIAEFPEWHAYIRHVYGESAVQLLPLDLNQLSWFYWFAPIRLNALFLCDWIDSYREAPFGTPWTGGLAAWTWGPEHLVRAAGFFVHRPRWKDAEFHRSERLEVMRIGPLEQRGFVERNEMWFYHAVGSGIFVPTGAFNSPVEVRYERHMSVPRIELVGRSRQIDDWWPSAVRFELHDRTPCVSTAREKRILSCANLPVPLWAPDADPLPSACSGGIAAADGSFVDGGLYGRVPFELNRDTTHSCGTPHPPPPVVPPRPLAPPRPPLAPPARLRPPAIPPARPPSPQLPRATPSEAPQTSGSTQASGRQRGTDGVHAALGVKGDAGSWDGSAFSAAVTIVTLVVCAAGFVQRRRRLRYEARALAAAKATDIEIDTMSLVKGQADPGGHSDASSDTDAVRM